MKSVNLPSVTSYYVVYSRFLSSKENQRWNSTSGSDGDLHCIASIYSWWTPTVCLQLLEINQLCKWERANGAVKRANTNQGVGMHERGMGCLLLGQHRWAVLEHKKRTQPRPWTPTSRTGRSNPHVDGEINNIYRGEWVRRRPAEVAGELQDM